jgi:hypothetical protein
MEGEWNMLIQGAKKYKSEMATEGGRLLRGLNSEHAHGGRRRGRVQTGSDMGREQRDWIRRDRKMPSGASEGFGRDSDLHFLLSLCRQATTSNDLLWQFLFRFLQTREMLYRFRQTENRHEIIIF